MTEEESKLLKTIAERLAVAEAKIEALRTAAYRELSLEERVGGAMMLPKTGTGGALLAFDEELR